MRAETGDAKAGRLAMKLKGETKRQKGEQQPA